METNNTDLASKETQNNIEPPKKFHVNFEKFLSFLKRRNTIIALLVIVAIIGGIYAFSGEKNYRPDISYSRNYRLVPEELSKSAPIVISLPKDTDVEQAKSATVFNPKIEGDWIGKTEKVAWWQPQRLMADVTEDSIDTNTIIFKPRNPLDVKKYYGVTIDLGDGKVLASDFLVAEDPHVSAIFPASGSEAPSDSKVTIVFNRPIVPLTTIDQLEKKDIPVSISPETPGHFEWISTNTLQFVPDEGLSKSTNYTVKVKDGFVSMDGLSVGNFESTFKTLALRYADGEYDMYGNSQIYNQPISVYFNQPVDIDKIKSEISITNKTTNKNVKFEVKYGTKSVETKDPQYKTGDDFLGLNFARSMMASISDLFKTDDSSVDKTVIEIYQKTDSFGRKNFWDMDDNYEINIKKAYPLLGDINIDNNKLITFNTSNFIDSWKTYSKRANSVTAENFDPQGYLTAVFFEDIDLSKSKITGTKIQKIEYGEKCKNENESEYNCEKTENKKKLNIYFNSDQVGLGEKLNISLEKIVNMEGIQINEEKVDTFVVSYKPLSINFQENYDGSLRQFYLCSNNPLAGIDKDELGKKITSDTELQVKSIGSSYVYNSNKTCSTGQYSTYISVGFMPQHNYTLNLDLNDVYGQNAKNKISFTTGEMDTYDTRVLSYQNRYSVTGPDKTKLNFATQNVTSVDLKICKASALNMARMYSDGKMNTALCDDYKTEKINLPQKYWINNYFSFNISNYYPNPIGNYVIMVEKPTYSEYESKLIEFVAVTNLAVAEKAIDPAVNYISGGDSKLSPNQLNDLKNLYWVTDSKTQMGIQGATVSFYDKNGGYIGGTLTKADGVALASPSVGVKYTIVNYGYDNTVIMRDTDTLGFARDAYNFNKTYIYTDKPLYRPGQTVYTKGIIRLGYDGNYQIVDSKKTVDISVKSNDGTVVLNKTVSLSDYGTFNFDFELGKDSSLGTYRICVLGNYQCANFDILEYVPAAYQVSQTSSKDEYISKDNAEIGVQADYYFGAPVMNASVDYTISSQNYYFDKYSGNEWFRFGSTGDYYDDYYYNYGDRFISRGSGTTDAKGAFNFSQNLDLDEMSGAGKNTGSKIIVVDSTVKDSLGHGVSNQQSFIVHQGEYYMGVKTSPYFVGKNQDVALKVKTVDTNGNDKQVKKITANIYNVDWVYSKRQDVSGNFVYDWEEKRDKVKTIDFSTDNNGNWSQNIQLDKEGSYSVELTSVDSVGNTVQAKTYVYVFGDGHVDFRYNDSTQLDIEANKTELNAGEKGEIIVKSPFDNAKALIAIERGKVFDYKIVDVKGSLFGYSFDALDDYAPNVFVSVLLQSPEPSMKFGSKEFTVNSEKSKINLKVTSEKKSYKPGDNVTLDVLATDSNGNPLKTETSIAVVDLSVLALKGNPQKDPLVFFYDGLPLTVSTGSNLKNKIVEIEPQEEDGGKGGGGGDDSDVVRGVFKDTAYWNATVITGNDGKAKVTFKLPDNLTTWQTEALAITKDTKVGISYTNFQTKKDIMVVPLKPRFIIPGDHFSIGAQVFNQSDRDQSVTVTLKSDTLSFDEKDAQVTVSIKKGEQKALYFSVQAPESYKGLAHTFTLRAHADNMDDAVSESMLVKENTTYEVTATSGYTDGNNAREVIYIPSNVSSTDGDLTIRSSATLAVFLSDALNYLINFPYGCSEQISSKLSAIAIIKNSLKVPNLADKFKLENISYHGKEYTIDQMVEIGLTDLYKNQNYDGGFSMWGNWSSSYYVTLTVVDALNTLKNSGYGVDKDVLNSAADYLYSYYNDPKKVISSDGKISLAAVLMRVNSQKYGKNLSNTIRSIVSDDKIINDQLSNYSLAELGVLVNSESFSGSMKKKVNEALDNRVNIDSRGAFIGVNDNNFYYDYYESTISNTALYLQSIALGKRDTAINDKIVRWLLNSRDKDGSWGSTRNTLAVVEAFTDYLNWKKETSAEYTLDTIINNEKINSFEFNSKTVLEQDKNKISISDLKKDDYNTLNLQKEGTGSLYYDMSLKYYLTGNVAPRDRGFTIRRDLYALDDVSSKTPLVKAKAGDVIREHLTIIAPVERRNVQIEDFIPAGLEIVDLSLATESKNLRFNEVEIKAPEIYPDFKEIRDDRAYIYTSRLDPGVYEFDYYVRALVPGTYNQMPAMVSEVYTPENFGRTGSKQFEVTK